MREKNEKENKIQKEIRRYKKMYANVDENKRILAEKLYNELAFMSVTLWELKENMNEKGAVLEQMNGNGFRVTAENPAQKSYNAIIKNYNAVAKALADILSDAEGPENSELLQFIRRDNK